VNSRWASDTCAFKTLDVHFDAKRARNRAPIARSNRDAVNGFGSNASKPPITNEPGPQKREPADICTDVPPNLPTCCQTLENCCTVVARCSDRLTFINRRRRCARFCGLLPSIAEWRRESEFAANPEWPVYVIKESIRDGHREHGGIDVEDSFGGGAGGCPFRGKLPHLVVCGIFHKTNRPKLFCLKEGMVAFAVSLTLTGRVLRRAGSLTH